MASTWSSTLSATSGCTRYALDCRRPSSLSSVCCMMLTSHSSARIILVISMMNVWLVGAATQAEGWSVPCNSTVHSGTAAVPVKTTSTCETPVFPIHLKTYLCDPVPPCWCPLYSSSYELLLHCILIPAHWSTPAHSIFDLLRSVFRLIFHWRAWRWCRPVQRCLVHWTLWLWQCWNSH